MLLRRRSWGPGRGHAGGRVGTPSSGVGEVCVGCNKYKHATVPASSRKLSLKCWLNQLHEANLMVFFRRTSFLSLWTYLHVTSMSLLPHANPGVSSPSPHGPPQCHEDSIAICPNASIRHPRSLKSFGTCALEPSMGRNDLKTSVPRRNLHFGATH